MTMKTMVDFMISFRCRSKILTFSPGLISTVITLLLLPVFVYLGFWQLHRMEEKKAMQDKIELYSSQAPLIFDHSIEKEILNKKGTASFFETTNSNNYRYQKIQVRGRFLNQINFLLDNQIFNGRVGYAVLTAFQIENSEFESLILVNRGWIPRTDNRMHTIKRETSQKQHVNDQLDTAYKAQVMQKEMDMVQDEKINHYRRNLPKIEPILGEITLTGMINRPSHGIILNSNSSIDLSNLPRFDLSEQDSSQDSSVDSSQSPQAFLIQNIDFKELSGIVSNLLLPILVQLPKESPYAFDVLPIDFSQNISRHLGYAVQWFSIALACLIYYLVINTRAGTRAC